MVKGLRGVRGCVVAIGVVVLSGAFAGRAAAADDGKICAEENGDVAIAACTRAIESGKYKDHALANKYNNRGVEWKLKKDYDRAFADYSDAIRNDKLYADGYYNRCIIYNLREDYDHALADCSQAIKLGPSAGALSSTGNIRLGDDRTTSDYYAQRGLAYLGKKDYSHAIADYDKGIALNPKNASAVRNRGRAYQGKGDTAHADADFELAKKMVKEPAE
jgi:tetratricopeptide (TPR) repeat protein